MPKAPNRLNPPVELGVSSAKRIGVTTVRTERGERNLPSERAGRQRSLPAYAAFALTPAAGIEAAMGTFTPSSAVCEMYVHDPITNTIVDGLWTETVWNDGTAAVAGGALVGVVYRGGFPYADCCAGKSGGGRCDCPDDAYEVNVSCGNCVVMPKIWWLTLTAGSSGTTGSCVTGANSTLCIWGLQTYKLTYDPVGPGQTDPCLWTGHGAHCIDVELDLTGGNWTITVVDRHGCVLVVLQTPVAAFNCCGPNNSWTVVSGACQYKASLSPDPCTCCKPPTAPCPPPGERTCPAICCENICVLTARWTATCPAVTCPDPPAEGDPPCVPQPSCTSAGEVAMQWQGGCTWAGEEKGITGGVAYDRKATFVGDAGTLDISVLMPDGRTCTYHCVGTWDCSAPPTLTCTPCPGGFVTATIDPVPM